jgi:hypothetical protein
MPQWAIVASRAGTSKKSGAELCRVVDLVQAYHKKT